MATNTTNYGWTKPDYEDDADIAVLNETFDAIDAQVKTIETALDSKQNALSSEQLAAINSGIDSTKVAQIETNKNNILKVADQTTKYNICDYTRVKTAQYPDSSTGATISFDSDSLEYTINGTTNSTGTLLSNIYFDTATTKAIPNGEWVAQIYPPHIQVTLNAVATTTTTGTSLRPLVFSVTADDTRSWVRIELGKNITFDNYKFKLMITPKSVWDSGFTSYQPYAMSNAELTAKEQQNKNNISTLQDQFKRSSITDAVADSATSGTLYGTLSLTDFTDAWGVLYTYVLNAEGNRILQICETPNVRKKRFYSGTWSAWA